MKRHYILAFLLMFSLLGFSQISIERIDFGEIGDQQQARVDTFEVEEAQFITDLETEDGWDFQGLEADKVRDFELLSPDNTPNGTDYQDCNIVLGYDNVFSYNHYSESSAEVVAFDFPMGNNVISVPLTDHATITIFPTVLNSEYTDEAEGGSAIHTSAFEGTELEMIAQLGDSVRFEFASEADGVASQECEIVTNYGTYDVLKMVKDEVTTIDLYIYGRTNPMNPMEEPEWHHASENSFYSYMGVEFPMVENNTIYKFYAEDFIVPIVEFNVKSDTVRDIIYVFENSELSNDASLANLTVNDTQIEGFVSTTFDYTYVLPQGSETYPTVVGEANHENASVDYFYGDFPGIVTITVTAEDEEATQDYTIEFSIETSITENTSDFMIYPNPANNFIKIENANNSIVEIYNMLGEIVLVENINSNLQIINIDNLKTGVYFVKSNNKTQQINIVK